MNVMMNDSDVHKNEFILFLEDDWLINPQKFDLAFYLDQAVKLLKKNKDILCVRINDEINTDVSKSTKISEYIYLQNSDYGTHGATLTFQPTIMRTRDWYAAVRLINRDWPQVGHEHCEILSGKYMRALFSSSDKPFAFFNPEYISAKHIGTEEFAKENG